LNTVLVDPDQRPRRTGESYKHVHEVPIRVFLCAQELRTSGIVPLKEQAVYDKPENIGRDEENSPAQNETFHMPSKNFHCCQPN
jgi:hypothetical protein